jgi:carboxypeptidase C (cathepsin A)
MRNAMLAILLTLFVSTAAAVRADEAPKGDKPPGDKGADKAAAAPAAPRKFVTHHRFTAGGVDIPYTATAQGTKNNEALRVFTASGYYDLATAYFANAYMMHHSGIDPARVTIRNYPAGHMMYLNQGSLEQLSRDIGELIQGK